MQGEQPGTYQYAGQTYGTVFSLWEKTLSVYFRGEGEYFGGDDELQLTITVDSDDDYPRLSTTLTFYNIDRESDGVADINKTFQP